MIHIKKSFYTKDIAGSLPGMKMARKQLHSQQAENRQFIFCLLSCILWRVKAARGEMAA